MSGWKTLIAAELLVLWIGAVGRVKTATGGSLSAVVAVDGVKAGIPVALIGFWLFLVADLGADSISALLGAIIAFSYLTGSVQAIVSVMDSLLAMSGVTEPEGNGGTSETELPPHTQH